MNSKIIGPLVDDGAPYSAIGMIELKLLRDHLGLNECFELDPVPKTLNGYTQWQYGTGTHASAARDILGSVMISGHSDNGRCVEIRHLVLDGSSQWVIGKNVTKYANILHADQKVIEFMVGDVKDSFSMIEHEFLSYIPLVAFAPKAKRLSVMLCLNGNICNNYSWNETKSIINKVHRHVCGHANYTDMRLLLERNNMWSDVVSDYVGNIIESCTACRSTAPPQPSRKVSISSLSRNFNDVVCLDHFFLESLCILHCMDMATRYSSASIVSSTSLENVIMGFESSWLSQFWLPDAIQADSAFAGSIFKNYLASRGIRLRLVPPRRHSRNPLESKHGIIRSIFLKLCAAEPNTSFDPHAIRSVSISNDLYGNDVMSSYELAKGFTKPIDGASIHPIPDDIASAHNQLQAKRKLALILKSKSSEEIHITPGDLVEVYTVTGMDKKGVWSEPKIVLSIDKDARTVTVPAKGGRRAVVGYEDTRLSLPRDSFAVAVQEAIDSVDESIHESVDSSNVDRRFEHYENHLNGDDISSRVVGHDDDDFSDEKIPVKTISFEKDRGAPVPSSSDTIHAPTASASSDIHRGDRILVFDPNENEHYPGTVQHKHRDGFITVNFDDGYINRINPAEEDWTFQYESDTDSTIKSSSSKIERDSGPLSIMNIEPDVVRGLLNHFGNKSFMRHEAQGFEQCVLDKSFSDEEETFLKNVKVIFRADLPSDANVVNSHVLYKVKHNDDGSLKLKARIAPHGNEDALKEIFTKDCTICPPTGLRIVESVASLLGWNVYKADVKSAFLQTGSAERQIYVKPPRESKMRSTHLWLLLTAAYELVNANAKWQVQSDACLYELGLRQCQQIPQLFYKRCDEELMVIVAKVVDDLKVAGSGDNAKVLIDQFNKKFKLGTVASGPGKLRFFGINTTQNEDMTICTNADDKLNSLNEYSPTRIRRKQSDAPLNDLEKAVFASTNSSLGWIGSAASPFFAFYASYLQQKSPETKVCHLIEQRTILRKLKHVGTTLSYPRPEDKRKYELSLLTFADASKGDTNGQIGVLTGLLVGSFAEDSIFHCTSWLSHKSKRPVKSVPAAEILAAGEAIDEAKCIAHAYSELLGMHTGIRLCVDSKDLFSSLSTQRNSIDRSIRADVACIRYEFQVRNIEEITWIPGKLNLADVLTKKDSAISEALQLTLFKGRLTLPFESFAESKSSSKNLGRKTGEYQ